MSHLLSLCSSKGEDLFEIGLSRDLPFISKSFKWLNIFNRFRKCFVKPLRSQIDSEQIGSLIFLLSRWVLTEKNVTTGIATIQVESSTGGGQDIIIFKGI